MLSFVTIVYDLYAIFYFFIINSLFKNYNRMKKIFFLLIVVSIFAINAKAQVLIGDITEPDPDAILELRSTNLGFLPTRVSLSQPSRSTPLSAHVKGMVVFNTNPTDSLQVGLYFNDGTKWVRLSTGDEIGLVGGSAQKWFYMPSIPVDVSIGGTIDLYDECKKQLNAAGGLVKYSAGAPTQVLATMPKATDLYYYVTGYDDTVFDTITIDANGKMTYTIKTNATVTDATYMNIVFVEK